MNTYAGRNIPQLNTQIELISWLKRGKYRRDVFEQVKDKTTPAEIVARLSKQRKSSSDYVQVSRALRELELQGLIKCLNPKEKTGGLYEKTSKGTKIII
ncbi:ArsR family transcriptional regulator [Candidatus Woesearchaeota archaeon]|nr:ArsR family transcriptional regulator [Candidatus Woesearchaeota archaeon]